MIAFAPRNPGEVRFRHRDVFDHSKFTGEFQCVRGIATGFVKMTGATMSYRQIGQAARLCDKVAASLRQMERGLAVLDGAGVVATPKVNKSEDEANMRKFRQVAGSPAFGESKLG